MIMIILTKEQADYVRGTNKAGTAGLDPPALADGVTFILPERVLDDPEHAEHGEYLSALPRREVAPEELVQEEA